MKLTRLDYLLLGISATSIASIVILQRLHPQPQPLYRRLLRRRW